MHCLLCRCEVPALNRKKRSAVRGWVCSLSPLFPSTRVIKTASDDSLHLRPILWTSAALGELQTRSKSERYLTVLQTDCVSTCPMAYFLLVWGAYSYLPLLSNNSQNKCMPEDFSQHVVRGQRVSGSGRRHSWASTKLRRAGSMRRWLVILLLQ